MNFEEKYYIEVFLKEDESAKKEFLSELNELGIEGVDEVLTRKIYLLYGSISEKVLEKIGNELLIDSVNERFTLYEKKEKGAKITIFFKPGVLDLESKMILEALRIMNIEGISSVKTGKKFIFKTGKRLSLETYSFLAEKLLYNKVIEKADIKFE